MTPGEHRRLRIALVLPTLESGGAEVVMRRLANQFTDRQYEVDLLLLEARGPLLEGVAAGVRIIDLNWHEQPSFARDMASRIGIIRKLATYMSRDRPDFLITSTQTPAVASLLARIVSRSRVRIVVQVNSIWSRSLGPRRDIRASVLRLLVRILYRRADAIVADSNGTAHDLVTSAGMPSERTRMIRNPTIPTDLEALAHANVPGLVPGSEENPLILGIARLVPEKDLATLIRAFAHVRAARRARLIVIGTGPEMERLQALAEQLGVSGDVTFPGFVANCHPYMRACSVFVLSSRFESMSLVLVEALANGAAVVATDCEFGPGEILDRGRHGRLVPVGDAAAMAEAITATLQTPPPKIPSEFFRPFEVDESVAEYERLFASLLAAGRR